MEAASPEADQIRRASGRANGVPRAHPSRNPLARPAVETPAFRPYELILGLPFRGFALQPGCVGFLSAVQPLSAGPRISGGFLGIRNHCADDRQHSKRSACSGPGPALWIKADGGGLF